MIKLGEVVATSGLVAWLDEGPESRSAEASRCLLRHSSGDWGEVCDEDKRTNDSAVAQDLRVISAYTIDGRKVWIITEWDRSVTTLLFPEEY